MHACAGCIDGWQVNISGGTSKIQRLYRRHWCKHGDVRRNTRGTLRAGLDFLFTFFAALWRISPACDSVPCDLHRHRRVLVDVRQTRTPGGYQLSFRNPPFINRATLAPIAICREQQSNKLTAVLRRLWNRYGTSFWRPNTRHSVASARCHFVGLFDIGAVRSLRRFAVSCASFRFASQIGDNRVDTDIFQYITVGDKRCCSIPTGLESLVQSPFYSQNDAFSPYFVATRSGLARV